MKVLLTGATGFLGSQVLASLASAEDEVVALRRPRPDRSAPLARPHVMFVDGDLGDAARLAAIFRDHRPDAVVHLAWFTQHGAYWTAPENLGCVGDGMQLVRLAAEHGCRRFVGAGTCAEYDWSHDLLVETTTPCAPRTLYGAAKLALFLVAERFAAQAGMSFAWARYSFLFGPGEAAGRLVSAAIESLSAGADFACSAGAQVRDFVHVDEAAAATAALLRSKVGGPVNIGSGEPVSVRQLIEIVADLVVARVGASGRPRFGALPTRPDDPAALVLDLARLRNEVGWKLQLPLRQALASTVARACAKGRPS
jgi:nucleoside-diphosphate-sugar epimerase